MEGISCSLPSRDEKRREEKRREEKKREEKRREERRGERRGEENRTERRTEMKRMRGEKRRDMRGEINCACHIITSVTLKNLERDIQCNASDKQLLSQARKKK